MESQPAETTSPPSGGTTLDVLPPTAPSDPSTWPLLEVSRALKKARNEMLRALSKKFGPIPDVPIFTCWNSRLECSDTAVHRSIVAGICGNKKAGTYSLALSNRYKDNEDGGDIIIYTGAGGRKKWSDSFPPKRLLFGPQIFDQSWDSYGNGALLTSLYTGNPIRVIRSWNSDSQYAPLKGYRYDGLYKIAECWTAKGRNGKDICRCRLERLPGQPPIPLRPITISTRKRRRICHRYVAMADTEPDRQIESDPSPTDYSAIPHPPQQRAMSEASTLIDFRRDETEEEVKFSPQPPSQAHVPLNSAILPRYRWNPGRNELVRVYDPIPAQDIAAQAAEEESMQEGIGAAVEPVLGEIAAAGVEDEELEDEADEHRVENDVTPTPPGIGESFT